jgi:hypothetical protein
MASKRKQLKLAERHHVNQLDGDESINAFDFRDMPEAFRTAWREMIERCEQQFESEMADFQYEVYLPRIEQLYDGLMNTAMLAYCDSAITYLREHFPDNGYVVFPGNAIGKYACKANSVFFRSRADAVLFKLGFV